jgi:lactoylglutathione lyase
MGGNIMTKPQASTIALGHIGINVSDIDVSEAFYQEVLGFRVGDESLEFPFRYASMTLDGKPVLTLWEHDGKPAKKRRPGLHHLAFEAKSAEEINRTKGLLKHIGTRWTEGARLYDEGARAAAIHFQDPDGIRIEVYTAQAADTTAVEMADFGLQPEIPRATNGPRMSCANRTYQALDGLAAECAGNP